MYNKGCRGSELAEPNRMAWQNKNRTYPDTRNSADTEDTMVERENCQICGRINVIRPAVYDAKLTVLGSMWGYVCQAHFNSHTSGIIGIGHATILREVK